MAVNRSSVLWAPVGNDFNHLVEGNQAGLFRSLVFERITRPYPPPLTTHKHFATYQILRL